jgi:PAS domain S-box-containing protein
MNAAIFAPKIVGSRPAFPKGLVIGAAALVALLVISAGLGFRNTLQLRDNDAWVAHTNEVLNALEGVLSTMQDAETGQRGFLITGDDRYLEPYAAAVAAIQSRVQRVKQLTVDNPRQQARIPLLEEEISAKLKELGRTIAVSKKDREAARQIILTGEGKKAMDAIRAQVGAMEQAERDLLIARDRQSRQSYLVAVLTILFSLVLGLGIVGVIVYLLQRYLSERQEAEEQRARSAEEILRQKDLLAVTLASIGDGVIVTDAQGRVTFLNGEAERLTGWTSGAAEGHPLTAVFNIINEHTRQAVEDPVEKVLRLGTVVGLANHTILVAKDGREIPIDDSGAPIRQSDGTVQGVVLVFRDFTEQKQAERSLARLAAIVESTDDAILSKDLSGIIQTWNAGADRLFGYRAEEVIGQPITLLLPPERIQEEEQILERLLSGQRVEHLETVRVAKDGRRVDVSVTVSPVKDQDGQIIGASKIVRDITDRKRAEEALRQTAEDLARSNKDLEQFAYVASHDLKEPLRMVTGFMSLLKDRCQGRLDAKSDEYISVACDAASRMQGLIDDLLAYSRAGRGEMTERTDVAAVLDKALKSLTVSVKESAAAITHDPLPAITSNPVELAQVFQNLIGNAIKFRGERKPEIHVGAQRQPGRWLFTVRDNGIGIDQQFADRIFMIFQRLHTWEQYPGTGIGLAICKKIVERHGGRIWMESQPGKGSTFYFTIADKGRDKDAAG